MVSIFQAATPAQLYDVRSLICAFVAWHRERHVQDIALIDRYFDAAAFDQELASLPGHYAPPKGSLLIAYAGEQPAGCVAMHDLANGACEMKRMFVPAKCRGLGVGRALAARIVAEAKAAGYTRMLLDTSKHQGEAIRLYESAGFSRVPPYYPLTADLQDWLIFFELRL